PDDDRAADQRRRRERFGPRQPVAMHHREHARHAEDQNREVTEDSVRADEADQQAVERSADAESDGSRDELLFARCIIDDRPRGWDFSPPPPGSGTPSRTTPARRRAHEDSTPPRN